MKAVLNTTPLIFLGKKRKTVLLKTVLKEILVAPEVEVEVMRLEESPEAIQLKNAIQEGWIRVERPPETQKKQVARLFPEIDEGEAATIALALKHRKGKVILDDAEARAAAEYFELDAHGTLYIILEAYRRSIINSKEQLKGIVDNMMRRGFYLSIEIYSRFLSLIDYAARETRE